MTIIVRPDYHALSVIEKNGIRWIPPDQAERQDIRPFKNRNPQHHAAWGTI